MNQYVDPSIGERDGIKRAAIVYICSYCGQSYAEFRDFCFHCGTDQSVQPVARQIKVEDGCK